MRFATQRYSNDASSYHQRRRHLTNYSVNKGHATGLMTLSRRTSTGSSGCGSDGFDDDDDGCLGNQDRQSSKADAAAVNGGAAMGGSRPEAGAGGKAGGSGKGGTVATPKWSLRTLQQHLEKQRHSWTAVWDQVGGLCCGGKPCGQHTGTLSVPVGQIITSDYYGAS